MNSLPHHMPATESAAPPTAAELAAWYAPWRLAHASWLQGEADCWMTGNQSDELLMRARYPAWCACFSLPLHPPDCAASIWRSLHVLESPAFMRVSHLAGLVPAVAADRRNSLIIVRQAAALLPDREDVKWAMQRASLVPKTAFALGCAGDGDEVVRRAAASVAFAAGRAAPWLVGRLALRYPRQYAADPVAAGMNADEADRCARWLERLWTAAFERVAAKEKA